MSEQPDLNVANKLVDEPQTLTSLLGPVRVYAKEVSMLLTNYAPVTDLYQLTMAQAYLKSGMAESRATFDLFVRNLPKDWTYLIACGIEEALDTLEDFKFLGEDINFLRKKGFTADFCDYLMDFRFRANVRGVHEGTPIFPDEPILEVTGNIIEAQLVETILLSLINYQTLICSKASRIVEAAKPATIVDFGLRRAPGPEAGIRAARAAYIAGALGTSNVEAAKRYGIPVSGTMAHSFVMACSSELDAFRKWCKVYPEGTTLLIDTYNIEQGARNACQVVREGAALKAVRIDSGIFAENTFRVRTILDDAGLEHVRIIVSGDMNEDKIRVLKGRTVTLGLFPAILVPIGPRAAPIDGYGVGTEMVTARPEAALGGVYKLVEMDGQPRVKLSGGKQTLPGRKQVWRFPSFDVLGEIGDNDKDVAEGNGRPLLEDLMRDGRRLYPLPPLNDIRLRCQKELGSLPANVVDFGGTYPVRVSGQLYILREAAEGRVRG